MIGKTLNHYKIIEKIGSGGMGEVYLAEDTKLNRKVALKVLPTAMAADQDRRGRFEREAKAVAALNHPNIVTIHSIEKSDPSGEVPEAVHFLTMEMVSGKSLTHLIPTNGMRLGRILEYGIALTEAMTAAHDKEITHRDLKPDNIMVGADGRLKILDFGLAKLREDAVQNQSSSTELPTQAVQTEEGRILGTVAYMAPEQLEGKPASSRSDVFSMGILLYEMATGQRPFQGDSRVSIISSIMRDTPTSITEINRTLPRHLGRIVKRCLMKDPLRRYGNARELHNDLLELKEEYASGELQAAGALLPPSRSKTTLWLGVAGGAVIIVLAAALAVVLLRSGAAPSAADPFRTTVSRVTDQGGLEIDPSISPDGSTVVYSKQVGDRWDIFLQRVEGGNIINLTQDSPGEDLYPSFSPDGARIAFWSDRDGHGIYVMGSMGGAVTRITEEGRHPAWSADGREIYYDTEAWSDARSRFGVSQLKAIDIDTGDIREIFEGDAVDPAASPNGHRIAFWGLPLGTGQRDIWTIPVGGGEPVPVTDDPATDWSPVWSPDGKFLYFNSDRGGSFNIWRVPIDERTGEVQGELQPVTTGIADIGDLSVAADGRRIAYEVPHITNNIWKAGFDPDNATLTETPVAVTRGSKYMFSAALSPDEKWIAYFISSAREDILIERINGTGRRRLTDDNAKDRGPVWSPDGTRLAFYSDRDGSYEIWTVQADGRNLRKLTDIPKVDVQSPIWSPDGTRLAYNTPETSFIMDPLVEWEDQTPEPLPAWDGGIGFFGIAGWSPDGKHFSGNFFSRPRADFGVMTWEGFGLYSLETGEYEKLIEKGEFEDDIFLGSLWLSDNLRILFQYQEKIYLLDRVSRQYRQVEGFEAKYFGIVRLSPDDQTLYWLQNSLEGDIWMLELE